MKLISTKEFKDICDKEFNIDICYDLCRTMNLPIHFWTKFKDLDYDFLTDLEEQVCEESIELGYTNKRNWLVIYHEYKKNEQTYKFTYKKYAEFVDVHMIYNTDLKLFCDYYKKFDKIKSFL